MRNSGPEEGLDCSEIADTEYCTNHTARVEVCWHSRTVVEESLVGYWYGPGEVHKGLWKFAA